MPPRTPPCTPPSPVLYTLGSPCQVAQVSRLCPSLSGWSEGSSERADTLSDTSPVSPRAAVTEEDPLDPPPPGHPGPYVLLSFGADLPLRLSARLSGG